VDIDAANGRNLQDRFRKDLTKGHYHH